ncbi:ABC transporter permease [Vallicoccus soli]|uniref:ABC transporter permease n=1 Tax=Vallicoccus soli TaxID=2339232 RepID=A0A3A3YYT3_9ACTN|nr:ABC transporter permease [Vallicoccus soli]RJK94298.1 ABC transporter permease [Vallicoccus soli]
MSSATGTPAGSSLAPGAPITDGGVQESRWERAARAAQERGALAVLVLVVLVASFAFDTFATGANLSNIAIQSAFLAVIALGMTFVIITGGIDLSVGSVYALGGVLAAWGSQHGTWAALLVPLVVCGGIGLVNGLLIARGGMAPFIVTLATLLFARGLTLTITDSGAEVFLVPQGSSFSRLGQGELFGIAYPVYVALGLFALGALLLQRTAFGQTVLAVGSNEDAATLMGMRVQRAKLLAYVLSGTLAGFAGAMLAARSSSGVPTVGVGLELDAIAAVVIGGTLLTGGAGTTGGTLCGVLLLGVIQNVINQIGSLGSSYQSVVSGAFLIVVVVVQTFLSRRRR